MTVTLWPAQDFYTIAGDRSPGKAIVTITKAPRGWDERKGTYLTGATLVPIGDPLGEFRIRHEFWNMTDWPRWLAFFRKYFEKNTVTARGSTTPSVITIDHPVLKQPVQFGPCVVLDPHGPEKSEDGLWSQTIDFKQYRKPIPAPSKPLAAIPDAVAQRPTAKDNQDREIQALQNTLANLQGRPQ